MSLKSLAKAVIPKAVIAEIQRRRIESAIAQLRTEWDKATPEVRPHAVSRPLQRLLIVPSDPITFAGSLGDDAMITACIETAREINPNVEIHAVTAAPAGTAEVQRRGCVANEIWDRPDFFSDLVDLVNSKPFDAAAALGADVMDGYYGPASVTKMLAICDLVGRSGAPTVVLGYSFNASPSPYLRPAFARLDDHVALKVRDAISLDRFRAFSDRPAELVSDSAFSLTPRTPPEDAAHWIERERAKGRKVIGINTHPMLIKNATDAEVQEIVAHTAQTLLDVAARRDVSWLLLPHDYREFVGDGLCLAPIRDRIAPKLGDRVAYLEGQHAAGVLKGLAGRLDGVMTARMHLAIGSLGMGTPTMSITYQDKFEGLYRHFDLPDWLLITPQQLLAGDTLRERLERFIDQLDDLRQRVDVSLPKVRALSRENFAVFSETPAK
ncbi:polysaccharide pyruvyl transferase family protein [Xanthobacter autotrophicus]|uniref:polysaccharide pyruvyl transferase family protein n=1 Tax=Xanthobacter autotrophicus TaxID=280 RepID=UPI00372C3E65